MACAHEGLNESDRLMPDLGEPRVDATGSGVGVYDRGRPDHVDQIEGIGELDRPLLDREAPRTAQHRVAGSEIQKGGNRFASGHLTNNHLDRAGALAGVGILDRPAFAPHGETVREGTNDPLEAPHKTTQGGRAD
jgi:hypothetical protein